MGTQDRQAGGRRDSVRDPFSLDVLLCSVGRIQLAKIILPGQLGRQETMFCKTKPMQT